MTRDSILRVVFSALLLLLAAVPRNADAALVDDYQELARVELSLVTWEQSLGDIERRLSGPERFEPKEGDQLRTDLAAIDAEAADAQARITKESQQTQQLLDSLGATPETGQPEESPAIAASRRTLEQTAAKLNGYAKRLELIRKRVTQLSQTVGERERAEITRELLDVFPSPLSPSVAIAGARDFLEVFRKIVEAPILFLVEDFDRQLWWNGAPAILLTVLAVFAAWWISRAYLWRRYGRDPAVASPTYARKVLAEILVVLLGGILPMLMVVAPVGVIASLDVVTGLSHDIMVAAAAAFARFVLTMAFLRAALAPGLPQWRLLDVADDSAIATYRRVFVVMAVLQVAVFLNNASQALYVSRELEATFVFVTTIVISINILALSRSSTWRLKEKKENEAQDPTSPPTAEEETGLRSTTLWVMLRILARITAIAAPLLAAIGYTRLAAIMIGRAIDIVIIVGFFYLIRSIVRDFTALAVRDGGRVNQAVKRLLGQDQAGVERMFFWLALIADVVVVAAGAFFIAITLGASPNAVLLTAVRTLEGFEVGSVVISPAAIVAGIVVFVGFLVATRVLRTFLVQQVLTKTHVDEGVRHSIGAGLGYVGMAVGGLVAISVVGLDLSNLAIIAGALSVGIGFGLQTIVNNFVAGVILLIERPVKVGDWIRVSGHEGTVKRINVRATEIQTFSRQSVIIPNSDLVSNALINFTHRDRYCRLDIPVGVGHGEDPDVVRDALLSVAANHEHIPKFPASYVMFREIGKSALEFELRVYISDTDHYFGVWNDMRYGVFAALRERGIAIAHEQRDVHLPEIDRIVEAIRPAGGPAPTDAGPGKDPVPEAPADR